MNFSAFFICSIFEHLLRANCCRGHSFIQSAVFWVILLFDTDQFQEQKKSIWMVEIIKDGRKLVKVYSAWTSVYALCKMEKGPLKRNVTFNRHLTLWITTQTKLPDRAESLFRAPVIALFRSWDAEHGWHLAVCPSCPSTEHSWLTCHLRRFKRGRRSSLTVFLPLYLLQLTSVMILSCWMGSTWQQTGEALNPQWWKTRSWNEHDLLMSGDIRGIFSSLTSSYRWINRCSAETDGFGLFFFFYQ